LVTYHPSALLRNPEWKKPAWIDLQEFQKEYQKFLTVLPISELKNGLQNSDSVK